MISSGTREDHKTLTSVLVGPAIVEGRHSIQPWSRPELEAVAEGATEARMLGGAAFQQTAGVIDRGIGGCGAGGIACSRPAGHHRDEPCQ
jgi:hypothetical protein